MSFSVWSFAEDPEVSRNSDFHKACMRGDYESVKKYLDEGADVNTTRSDMPALLLATHGNFFDVALELVKRGATANCFNRFGTAPLHFAAEKGHMSLVKALIDDGAAFVHRKDKNGDTALHYAARNSHQSVMEFLLEKGIDANGGNYVGDTALHYAAKNNNKEIVELLVKNGANPNQKNHEEQTPISLATEPQVKALMEALALRTEVSKHLAPEKQEVVSLGEFSEIEQKEKKEQETQSLEQQAPAARRRILKA